MQYGVEVYPYKRVNKNEKQKNEKKYNLDKGEIIKKSIYFMVAFLISRVILINLSAPFGIAALMVFLTKKDGKIYLMAVMGTVLGYLTLINNINDVYIYFIIIVTLLILHYFVNRLVNSRLVLIMLLAILLESLLYMIKIQKLTWDVSILISVAETFAIAAIYVVVNYSFVCFQTYKKKHLYTNEELISMVIGVSLMICGTWGISFLGISIRNIFAIIFIIIISYINGSGVGTAAGVAMGIVVGLTSQNMSSYISIYGLCGLTVGVFKDTGKYLSVLAYIAAATTLMFYSQTAGQFKLIEALISSSLFLVIPNKMFNDMALEFNKDLKIEKLNENYIDKIKSILMERLDDLSEVLYSVSEILNKLVDNDKLAQKSKSSTMVENLAERVCSSCDMNNMCWKRELHYTYSAFSDLIENFQRNSNIIPEEIERKCIRRTQLLKHTEEIINNHIINEMWRNRLSEGREVLSDQIKNMGNSLKEMMEEFNCDIIFHKDLENRIRNILGANNIEIKDSTCSENKKGRLSVKVSMDACEGNNACVKKLLPLINEAVNRNMCINDDGCRIDISTKICVVTFEETPKYYVSTFVSRRCKDGEKYNGDSYYFTKLKDNTYMAIISDGMGSGPQASQESKAVIDLIENLTAAGFSKITAINTANSMMTLKFCENEKFSTVDLSSIDLYTGEVEFIKVGAVSSFIKSGDKVVVINSKTLPMGVLDKVDVDINRKRVKNGDIIVMLSDGVTDSVSVGNTDWIVKYLKECDDYNPKTIAEDLIEKSRRIGGSIKDDMTVLVLKIISLY